MGYKLSKMQRIVYQVIQANPGVQNNDAQLVAAVWRHLGWSDTAPLEENITKVARAETITRRRRELHEKGLITYSDEANKEREEAFRNERDAHSASPWA